MRGLPSGVSRENCKGLDQSNGNEENRMERGGTGSEKARNGDGGNIYP